MISRPAGTQQPVVLPETARTERVEGDVDALASGDPVDLGLEVPGAVVDRMSDAELRDRRVLGRRRGAEDLRATPAGDLNGGRSDPAARGMDQDALALASPLPSQPARSRQSHS
jgi:hypothetical protein